MLARSCILALLLLPASRLAAQEKKPAGEPAFQRWTTARAQAWYKRQPWLVGCNFIPSTAINQLEMWQADTFDRKTIDRELGWAEDLGFTSVRVFLHDLPWKEDAQGFAKRIDQFLEIADRHHILVMLVLLDSCWHPEPKSGKQPEPRPHLHNSGWVQAPGVAVLKDPEKWKEMEGYVKGVLSRFKEDRRILCWDLWNEPENNSASSYGDRDLKNKEQIVLPLLEQVFAWARAVNPSQPLTAAPWVGSWSKDDRLSPINRLMLEASDIITFHRYENLAATKKSVESLRRYDRPLLCSEYMARPAGSTFEAILPYFKEQNVGAYCWGFVSGKTQTIYPWDSWNKKYTAEPKLWFHDILRADGTPYDAKEVKRIKQLTGKALQVKLRIPVEVLDPFRPDNGIIEGRVHNDSDQAVQVPTLVAGGFDPDITLKALDYRSLHLVIWADRKKQEYQRLPPGEEVTVFKDTLNQILLLDVVKDQPLVSGQRRYYWTWMA